jgi:aspartate-semialdehyde dehydrogenase
MRAHSESVWAETEKPGIAEAFRAECEKFKGITVIDNPANNKIIQCPGYCGKDDVYVGRYP